MKMKSCDCMREYIGNIKVTMRAYRGSKQTMPINVTVISSYTEGTRKKYLFFN